MCCVTGAVELSCTVSGVETDIVLTWMLGWLLQNGCFGLCKGWGRLPSWDITNPKVLSRGCKHQDGGCSERGKSTLWELRWCAWREFISGTCSSRGSAVAWRFGRLTIESCTRVRGWKLKTKGRDYVIVRQSSWIRDGCRKCAELEIKHWLVGTWCRCATRNA